MKDFDVDIYLDGPKLEELSTTYNVNVAGYTFNPSLFRSNNAENYIDHSKKILTHIQDKPVSLEVIADSFDEMISQAVTLNALAENVFVKIQKQQFFPFFFLSRVRFARCATRR